MVNELKVKPAQDNCLEPSKRTFHSINPGFLTR
ncbi:hypothetical protein GPJ61_22225 [Brevibacillus formosus]|nr:hypothetical protein [Brevibacillus formosus]